MSKAKLKPFFEGRHGSSRAVGRTQPERVESFTTACVPARKAHYLEGLKAAAGEEKAAEQKQLQHSMRMPHIAQDLPKQPGSSTMQLEAQPTAPLRMTAGHLLSCVWVAIMLQLLYLGVPCCTAI